MAVSRIIDGEVPLIKAFLVCLNGGGKRVLCQWCV